MKIGLWTDSIHFPNLAQMKISAYHKKLGDEVEFIKENGHYDKVYLSKVFNLPGIPKIPDKPPNFSTDLIERGGTGYAIQIENGKEVFHRELHKDLPLEIENIYPDYSLYPEYPDKAIGFLTRGCVNNCPFCIVCPKEGLTHKVADLEDFWRGQKEIEILDPNILACKDRTELLEQVISSKASVIFHQGLDARFINDEICDKLSKIRLKYLHFAWDLMKYENQILKGIDIFNKHNIKVPKLKAYVLTNFNTTDEENWHRVVELRNRGVLPYITVYQRGTQNQFVTDLARWCNNLFLCKSTSFEDYVPRVDGKSCKELYPEILKSKEIFIMATKEKTALSGEGLNIYQKLALAREEILKTGVKKSGVNLHAEFTYFELEDIVPVATPIFTKLGLLYITTFPGKGIGRLIDTADPTQTIEVEAPMELIAEPAKFRMNETQALGAVITYMRRYLYFLILDLVEHDKIDDRSGAEETEEPKKPARPATVEERAEIKEELTAPNAQADELQISALKAALKELLTKDSSQEEFVQQIAVKTNGFTAITKTQCETLINGIQEMLAQYKEG